MMTTPPPYEPKPVPGHQPIPELTEQLALAIGSWDSRFARVLVIGLDGPVGISVIDPNADGSVTEVEHVYLDDTGHWCAGGSSGGGTPDLYGVHGSGSYAGPEPGTGVRYVYGRADTPGPLTVPGPCGDLEVIATHAGWWAWVHAHHDDSVAAAPLPPHHRTHPLGGSHDRSTPGHRTA